MIHREEHQAEVAAGKRAEPGASYRGRVLFVGSDHVIQEDTQSHRRVRNELRAVGDVADVRYPHGTVGLVTHQREVAQHGAQLNHSLGAHQREAHAHREMER
ncbi:hypothetical protein [Castellaniella sp. UC4442_H9]